MSAVLKDLVSTSWLDSTTTPLAGSQVWIALAIATVIATVIFHWKHAIGSHRAPPKVCQGPGFLPVLGNALHVIRNYHHVQYSLADHFKTTDFKTFTYCIPWQPIIIYTADPRNVEHMLKTNFDNYPKGKLVKDRMADGLGDGIFSTDGHPWWLQRKAVSRIFFEAAFNRFMEEVFTEKMVFMRKRLDAAAATGTPIDLHALFLRYTFDSFCQLAFGYDSNSLTVEDKTPFMAAFDRMTYRMASRFYWPAWRLVEKVTGLDRQMAEDIKFARGICAELVNEKLAKSKSSDPKTAEPVCKDLLTLVIELAQSEPESQEILTEKFLVDVVLNMLLAGRDTTAQALSWSVHYLMQRPEAAEKVRQEVEDVLGYRPQEGGDKIKYHEVKRLKYTNYAMLEAIRLNPPVPYNPRTAVKQDVLPDGTIVPAGATLAVATIGVGRNPHLWGPDADQFRPERWQELTAQPSSFQYPTFHAGPRICVGRNMAQLEATYVLAELFSHYDFKLVEGHPVMPETSLTMPMRFGLKVHVSPRKGLQA